MCICLFIGILRQNLTLTQAVLELAVEARLT